MKMWIVAAAIVLSGCSTYSDLRERPADFSAETDKAPQAYAECVLPKWTDASAGAHIIKDGAASVIILPVGGGTPDAVMATLTAYPKGQGSRVAMKHMPSLGKFTKLWVQAKSCL